MNARQALADVLSAELDIDIDPEFMMVTDKILIRLYLHGYVVVAESEEAEDVAAA